MKCAAGKAHVDTKSTEEETDQEMDYCLGTYHLLPSVPVQSLVQKWIDSNFDGITIQPYRGYTFYEYFSKVN